MTLRDVVGKIGAHSTLPAFPPFPIKLTFKAVSHRLLMMMMMKMMMCN